MKIKLRTENFNGKDLNLVLEDFNFLTGDNGAGKTTTLEAIRVALTGSSQQFKRTSDLFKYHCTPGADEFTVILETEDMLIERNFKMNAKGNVTQVLKINGEKTSASGAALLLEKTFMPEDNYDIGNFLSLSEDKQQNLLMSILKVPDSTHDMAEQLKKICGCHDVKLIIEKYVAEENPVRFLANVVNDVRDLKNALHMKKQQYEKTDKTATEIKVEQKAVENITDLEDKLKELEEIIRHTIKEIAQHEQQARSAEQKKKQLDDCKARIESLQKAQSNFKTDSTDYEKLIQEKRDEYAAVKGRIEYLNLSIAAIGDGSVCPFSGQPCESIDLKATLEQQQNELDMKNCLLIELLQQGETLKEKKKASDALLKQQETVKRDLQIENKNSLQYEKEYTEMKQGFTDIDALKVKQKSKETEQHEVKERIKNAQAAREAQLVSMSAQDKKENVEAELEAVKEFLKLATEKRNRMLSKIVEPLEKEINSILFDTDERYSFRFFHEGVYVLQGQNKNQQWVPVQSLCGGEKAVFMSALIAGFVNIKHVGQRIVLVEGSELDEAGLNQFMNGVAKQSELFDFVVLVSWHKPTGAHNWNVIIL